MLCPFFPMILAKISLNTRFHFPDAASIRVGQFGRKSSRTFQGLSTIFSCDVLPIYGVFTEGDFTEYLMFLASQKPLTA